MNFSLSRARARKGALSLFVAVTAVGGSLDLSQIAGRASSVEPLSARGGSKVLSVGCACVPVCVPVCVPICAPMCVPICFRMHGCVPCMCECVCTNMC
jgi:hypothetical protein